MRTACFAAVGLIALAVSSAEAGTTSTTDFATWATGLGSYAKLVDGPEFAHL